MFRVSATLTEAPTLRAARTIAPTIGRMGVRQLAVASATHLATPRPTSRIAAIAARATHTQAQYPQTKSQLFSNLGTGFAGIIAGLVGAGTLWARANQIEETVRDVKEQSTATQKAVVKAMDIVEEHHPGRLIGLANTSPLFKRKPIDQADQYSEATQSLLILGVTGRRLTNDNLTGDGNPIKDELLRLASQGVTVRVVIYDKAVEGIKEEDVPSIRATVADAREMQKKRPGKILFRKAMTPLPFHGDLIDGNRADIVNVRPGTRAHINEAIIETYRADFGIPKGKKVNPNFKRIREAFEVIWDDAEEID